MKFLEAYLNKLRGQTKPEPEPIPEPLTDFDKKVVAGFPEGWTFAPEEKEAGPSMRTDPNDKMIAPCGSVLYWRYKSYFYDRDHVFGNYLREAMSASGKAALAKKYDANLYDLHQAVVAEGVAKCKEAYK